MSESDVNENKVTVAAGQRNDEEAGIVNDSAALKTDLKGRHMQMIAIGGAIGAGLFIGSGSALHSGGPASLIIGYLVVGVMLLLTMQALGEMAVMYPVNGAFYSYVVRFIDPSWGFAMGWQYALSWLTVLPFELIAASGTISYWRDDIDPAIWIASFLVLMIIIQFFGVRGYGEVEFILSIFKVAACIGFIILGIVINTGGVGNKGYIGAQYWHEPGAFRNGFNGFAGVFVFAAFAFGGTELVGLAAAESSNPRKAIPLAAKQVFIRIFIFYVVNIFILSLVLPSDDPQLAQATGSNSRFSPFVIAIKDAGIQVLPSIFNAIITLSAISVANSCTFGSTRTLQALAQRGMAPKQFSYIDDKGRPLWCVILQLVVGLLAFVVDAPQGGEAFTWLLALSGLAFLLIWGSCCLAHIRFRMAWAAQGRDFREIPYQAPMGIWGSAVALFLVFICLIATFYNALYPTPTATPNVQTFFQAYLAAFVALALYLFWKVYSGNWSMFVKLEEVDLVTGARPLHPSEFEEYEAKKGNFAMRMLRSIF